MSDAMRKQFEAWAREAYDPNGDAYSLSKCGDGEYMDQVAISAWQGWQAALEHAGQPPAPVVPDGWKLKIDDQCVSIYHKHYTASSSHGFAFSEFIKAMLATQNPGDSEAEQ